MWVRSLGAVVLGGWVAAGELQGSGSGSGSGSGVMLPELMVLEGYDNSGRPLLVDSVDPTDESVRAVLVSPKAEKFTLDLECSPGASLTIEGKKTNPGQFTFKRDKSRHTQVVEVGCEAPNKDPVVPNAQKYALLVMADFEEDEIPVPRLMIESMGGAECNFDEENNKFLCPQPATVDETTNKTSTLSMIRVVSENEPLVKYLLRDNWGTVDLRILNSLPTPAFTYKSTMKIVAVSARTTRTWEVQFGALSLVPNILRAFGVLLAAVLALLLLTLLVVVGSASISGIGVPLGATEVAATFTFLMQYLCFANFLRGASRMESIVGPMKWVTFFMPVPVSSVMSVSESPEGMSGEVVVGDLRDVRGAWGGMLWAMILVVLVTVIHCGVIGVRFSGSDRFTIPHRVRIGNWESRLVNWLTFPLSAACAVGVLHPAATVGTRVVGSIVLLGVFGWLAWVAVTIAGWVSNKQVCWIWDSSARETGRPLRSTDFWQADGYWSDVINDQLVTQPVNRSILPFFPYQWISTVADIQPVQLSHTLASDENAEVYPPKKMKRAHRPPSYPVGKAPQVVTVVKTREPTCCLGKRLIVGLFRTRWLDVLFTYEGLVKFMADDHGSTHVPLVVKQSQLTGPKTHGLQAFFFDGVRVPFIRVAETGYKLLAGIILAACSLEGLHTYHTGLYALLTLLSLAMGAYCAATKPFTRKLENWLQLAVYTTVSLASATFVASHYSGEEECCSWAMLALLGLCGVALAAYAGVVIFCVMTAVCCPPLNETRFLEKLSNCSVSILDPTGTTAVEVPGYSKYAARDLLAHVKQNQEIDNSSESQSQHRSTTGSASASGSGSRSRSGASSRKRDHDQARVKLHRYGSLEELALDFYHDEIRQACQTGDLPIPL